MGTVCSANPSGEKFNELKTEKDEKKESTLKSLNPKLFKIIDNADETKKSIQSLIPFLRSANYASRSALSSVFYSFKVQSSDFPPVTTFRERSICPRFNNCCQDDLEKYCSSMMSYREKIKILKEIPRKTVQVGDLFEPVHEILLVLGTDEKVTLEYSEGEILVVFFWKAENSESVKLLKACQQFLAKREGIDFKAAKVRFVALNCDDEQTKDQIKEKLVNMQLQTLFENYWSGVWNSEHNLWRNYGFFTGNNDPPLLIKTDRSGFVERFGNVNENELEKMLANIEAVPELSPSQMKEKSQFMKKLLKLKVLDIVRAPEYASLRFQLEISYSKYKVYDEEGLNPIKQKILTPHLFLQYNAKNAAKMKEMTQKICSVVGGESFFQIKLEEENPQLYTLQLASTLTKLLRDSNLHNEVKLSYFHRRRFIYENGVYSCYERRNIEPLNTVTPTKLEAVLDFRKSLGDYFNSCENSACKSLLLPYDGFSFCSSDDPFKLCCAVKIGDSFIKIPCQSINEPVKTGVEHHEGDVLLISFLDNWMSEATLDQMKTYQDMAMRINEKSGGKFKWAVISASKKLKKWVEVKYKWSQGEFYFANDPQWINQVYDYAISSTNPMLIDQKGRLVNVWSSAEDLNIIENSINELLKNGPGFIKTKTEEVAKLPEFNKNLHKKLKYLALNEKFGEMVVEIAKELCEEDFHFMLTIQKEKKFDENGNICEVRYQNPKFVISKNWKEAILDEVYGVVPKDTIQLEEA